MKFPSNHEPPLPPTPAPDSIALTPPGSPRCPFASPGRSTTSASSAPARAAGWRPTPSRGPARTWCSSRPAAPGTMPATARCWRGRSARARSPAAPARRRASSAMRASARQRSLRASSAWLRRRRRRCRLNGEFQLQKVRRRGLHLAHPGLRGAGGGHVLRLDLDALAALLVLIHLGLVGRQVRRSLSLLLLPALLFLLFQRRDFA